MHIALGGSGNSGGGMGRTVTVNNTGSIITVGDGAIGVLAQSIGGGGGIGGAGATGGEGSVTLGGSGGFGGAGGNIEIDVLGGIETYGVAAHGLFAQSVGGGGGYAGNADMGINESGINLAIGGSGGAGGNGGDILVNSTGTIKTHGDGSIGIFAQSVGGGGGIGGQIGEGFGFAGSAGKTGDGGKVEVHHTGDIITTGKYAHGIFAQSVGGADLGGDVIVTVAGNIIATGEGAVPVIAQSEGTAGKRNIDFTYLRGTVIGNSEGAVKFLDGEDNIFTNRGAITTVAGPNGTAFSTASGNDRIRNYGVVTGVVNLGDGANGFYNYRGATLNSGDILHLGNNALLVNEGTFSPGGKGLICKTALTGLLNQTSTARMIMELDMKTYQADSVQVTGSARMAGTVKVDLLNVGLASNGTYKNVLVSAADGMVDSGVSLQATRTAVLDHHLIFDSNGGQMRLETVVDTSPDGLTAAQDDVANYINRILATGEAEGFAPFAEQLFALPDVKSLEKAYQQLSPASYDATSTASTETGDQYIGTLVKRMHSVRSAIETHDQTMAVKQVVPNAAWLEVFGQFAQQQSVNGFTGYTANSAGTTIGYDYLINEWLLVGLSGSYAYSDIENIDNDGSGVIDSYYASVYGSVFSEQWYADMALSYGWHDFSNIRAVQIGGMDGIATSEHDGEALSTYIEGGYNFYVEDWLLQPYAAMRFSCLDEESYREERLNGANLYVDGRTTQSLVSDLGMRILHPFKLNDWVMIPEGMVAWDYDFNIDDRRLTAAFDSAPTLKFSTEGSEVEQHGLLAGFGLTMFANKSFNLSIDYAGEFREHYTAHTFTGGLRIEF